MKAVCWKPGPNLLVTRCCGDFDGKGGAESYSLDSDFIAEEATKLEMGCGKTGGLAFSASPGPLVEPPGQSLWIPDTCTSSSLLSPRLGVSPGTLWNLADLVRVRWTLQRGSR